MKKIIMSLLVIFLIVGCSNKPAADTKETNTESTNTETTNAESTKKEEPTAKENSKPAKGDAKSLLMAAYENMAKADNYSAKMYIEDDSETENNEKESTEIKIDLKNKKYEINFSENDEVKMRTFGDNENMYMEMSGLKMAMPADSIFETYSELLSLNLYKDVELKDSKVEKKGSDYVISYTLPAFEMIETLNRISGTNNNGGALVDESSISSSDMIIVIDKDMNIKSVVTSSTIASEDGKTYTSKGIFEYYDYNTTKIDFPSDLSEYQGYSE